ncbi:hypothetical protein AAS21_gp103 [Pantoea phage vB_PagS_AAS21]|uniref:Uncharacterized protein n=1 Tax=Pantoea phage vB_PagS_AAS21 TaxID=2575261 RepID=A0A4Y5P1J2_9CAUD|nr:hypothetical protein AAS21_gp103 [Pantoea phage vB_PagS_AAS21]
MVHQKRRQSLSVIGRVAADPSLSEGFRGTFRWNSLNKFWN